MTESEYKLAAQHIAKTGEGIYVALATVMDPDTTTMDVLSYTAELAQYELELIRRKNPARNKLPRPDRMGTPLARWDRIAACNRAAAVMEGYAPLIDAMLAMELPEDE